MRTLLIVIPRARAATREGFVERKTPKSFWLLSAADGETRETPMKRNPLQRVGAHKLANDYTLLIFKEFE